MKKMKMKVCFVSVVWCVQRLRMSTDQLETGDWTGAAMRASSIPASPVSLLNYLSYSAFCSVLMKMKQIVCCSCLLV